MAHNEASGELRISVDLLGRGLVGAQLADLVIAGDLSVEAGRVAVVEPRGSGSDRPATLVLQAITQHGGAVPVRTWIDALGDQLYRLVAHDLVQDGLVRQEPGRQLLRRRPDRFPANDPQFASGAKRGLEHMLHNPRDFDLPGAVLATLVAALGVEEMLDPEVTRSAARELTAELEDYLPAELRALNDGIRASAAAVSLTVRR